MLKVELCKTSPTCADDQTLKQHGHVATQLPSYHAELNSIELIVVMLKGKVAKTNLVFKKNDIQKLTEEAFETITSEDWAACCMHVIDVKKRF